MHTVIETSAYLRQATEAGMTEDDRSNVVALLARNPAAGDLIANTGGARKLRVAGRGKGKSGGYRVITYYGGASVPVFLLAAFGKGDKANLSNAEKNALAKLTATLVESLGAKVVRMRR